MKLKRTKKSNILPVPIPTYKDCHHIHGVVSVLLPAGLGAAGSAMSALSLKWLRLPGAQPIFSSLANHWDLQILTEQFWSIPISLSIFGVPSIMKPFWKRFGVQISVPIASLCSALNGGYSFVTGNDEPIRDPWLWQLWGSPNNVDWVPLTVGFPLKLVEVGNRQDGMNSE